MITIGISYANHKTWYIPKVCVYLYAYAENKLTQRSKNAELKPLKGAFLQISYNRKIREDTERDQ